MPQSKYFFLVWQAPLCTTKQLDFSISVDYLIFKNAATAIGGVLLRILMFLTPLLTFFNTFASFCCNVG
jgi:hypothetical protein